jgi:mxaA protein
MSWNAKSFRIVWRSVAALALALLLDPCVAADATAASDTAEPNTPAAVDAVVEQSRAFGHVVGDILEQRILLQIAGRDFEPAALPRAGRLSVWLERRPAALDQSADGRRWLVVPYQLINAPQALTTVSLPELVIRSRSGSQSLKIAAWPVGIAPLTSRYAMGEGGNELRPDHVLPPLAIDPIRHRFWMFAITCILTLAAWLGWLLWRNRRTMANQPFAAALRELRAASDGSPQSWQILHRAFDRTAGRVVRAATLNSLFEQAPHLEDVRAQIELFYAQSAQLFFGGAQPEQTLLLLPFCRALRQLEKRHER